MWWLLIIPIAIPTVMGLVIRRRRANEQRNSINRMADRARETVPNRRRNYTICGGVAKW